MALKTESHAYYGEGILRSIHEANPEYPDGYLWDALNCVYDKDSEEPEKMLGYDRLGSTSLGGYVTGLFDYDEGTRLIAPATDGAVYQYAGTDWAGATGGTGFSTSSQARWSGCMYYGATTGAKLLTLSNGVDVPQKYTSGAGMSALSAEAPATGKFPTSWLARLWLADGSTLYGSKTNNCEVFATGSGGVNILVDYGSGDITGLYSFMGDLFVFKRNKIFRVQSAASVADTDVRLVSSVVGCVSHRTIQEVGSSDTGALMFASEMGQVMAIIPTDKSGGYVVTNQSDPVKKITERVDSEYQHLSWGSFFQGRSEYYFHFSTSGEVPTEGVIANMARGRKRMRWTRNNMQFMTCGGIYRVSGEQIHVFGDYSGNVYRMHTGHDRNTSPYLGRLRTGAYTSGVPGYMKQYGKMYIDAVTSGNYSVVVRCVLGRKGLPSPGGSSGTLTTLGDVDGWGVGTWGVALWGGGGVAGEYFRPEQVARGYNMRFEIETTGADQWFKLNGLQFESEITANTNRA